jgi:hypothetical protein
LSRNEKPTDLSAWPIPSSAPSSSSSSSAAAAAAAGASTAVVPKRTTSVEKREVTVTKSVFQWAAGWGSLVRIDSVGAFFFQMRAS